MNVLDKAKIYLNLIARKRGKVFNDYVEGACYRYGGWAHGQIRNVGMNKNGECVGMNGKPVFEEFKMKSGHVAIYKLVYHKYYNDPSDMTEEARYQFLGYKGKKKIKDCTLNEYIQIYCSPLKKEE